MDDVGFNQRIDERDRRLRQLADVFAIPLPEREREHAVVANLADQDPIKLRGETELRRRAHKDPVGRTELAENADRVARSFQGVRPPHVVELRDLALEREQLNQHAFDVARL